MVWTNFPTTDPAGAVGFVTLLEVDVPNLLPVVLLPTINVVLLSSNKATAS
jgi:hypothetical protein